jgi:hypothetical protein
VKTTRFTEITVETDEVLVIRKRNSPLATWCSECDDPAAMLTPQEAAVLTGVSWREISRRVESGRVHFTETPDGLLLICINSLSR